MTKAELLEHIKDAPADAPVELFLFDEHVPVAYAYYIVDDPEEVTPIVIGWK